jgi:hypothetical protein
VRRILQRLEDARLLQVTNQRRVKPDCAVVYILTDGGNDDVHCGMKHGNRIGW